MMDAQCRAGTVAELVKGSVTCLIQNRQPLQHSATREGQGIHRVVQALIHSNWGHHSTMYPTSHRSERRTSCRSNKVQFVC